MKKINSFDLLKKKILYKKNVIGIIGLGYVGLPLAMAFSSSKIKTIGYDLDKKKITSLKRKKSYLSSVSSRLILKSKRYFNPTFKFEALSKSDVIIICVPTPINDKNKIPNLNYVKNVVNKMKLLNLKEKLIIFECTSYPGTTEEFFLPLSNQKKLKLGEEVFLGYSPEREDPGNLKYSLENKNIPKITSGYSKKCLTLTSLVYNQITNKLFKASNIKTAEFAKLLENVYRSVNIGLINEMSNISDRFKLDINEIINAAKSKPFGFQAFYPGPGVGGHCIPVDPYYLSWKAKKLGIASKFIKLAGVINDDRPNLIFKKIIKKIKQKKIIYKKILFLGVTYKKNTDDIRNSPILKIIKLFKKLNSRISYYDPYLNNKNYEILKKLTHVKFNKLTSQVLESADIVIIGADHDIFNFKLIKKYSKLIFDTRNVYKKSYGNIVKI